MKDIFEFNHIDKSLSESDIKTLKDFYKHYHKKYWCFKRSYKSYKFLDNFFTISGIFLVAIGTISGGITLNPVVLGVVNGAGVIVAGVGKKNNYKRKIEMSRIAFTTYEKVLVELREALRGDDCQFIFSFKVDDVDPKLVERCRNYIDDVNNFHKFKSTLKQVNIDRRERESWLDMRHIRLNGI